MKRIVVGVLAHVDAGKTTLSEGLLYAGGSIRKMGRVDNRDAFLDTHQLERERGITIFSKQAVIATKDLQITLLDTPGHMDFGAELERALWVLDVAVLIVSAPDGVDGHTASLWKLLKRYQIPVFIFVNKMDQPGYEKESLLSMLKREFSADCVDFSTAATAKLYESLATCSESLLNTYLSDNQIGDEAVRQGIQDRQIFPCFFGSALKMEGVEAFFELLKRYLPLPSHKQNFGARVYKISRDDAGNRMTFMKLTGGSLKVKSVLKGNDSENLWEEKVNQIRIYSGAKFENVSEAFAGDICAVTGLSKTGPGRGLGVEEDSKIPVLEPVMTYQMILPEEKEKLLVLPALKKLEEEIPELHILYHESLKELQVQIMGEVQLEVLKRLIHDRMDMEVSFCNGSIVYRETIADTVEGVGHFEPLRHYAEVHLLLEPLESGSGIILDSDCSEDMLDRNWQRLILTHLEEKEHKGVLTGAGITDIKITLMGGRAHVKHTEGGDFRQATYRALRQGLMQAQSVLLEPYYEFVLRLPRNDVGRAMSDLDRMQAAFHLCEDSSGDERTVDICILKGEAPVLALEGYPAKVSAYTKGKGSIACTLIGYRPCHNAEEVINKAAYKPEADIENTPDSVFCQHGVGTVVPWNEVYSYMHVPKLSGIELKENISDSVLRRQYERRVVSDFIEKEEIDQIMERTFYANSRGKNDRAKWKYEKAQPLVATYHRSEPKEKYLLVDGYNVIFAWGTLQELAKENINAARDSLQDILCSYQAITKEELILVFDAYRVAGHNTEFLQFQNIHLVYTREAETADQYIEHFAHENGKKHDVTVVTSDGLEQIIIRGQGCHLISSREFEEEVQRVFKAFRERFQIEEV